MRSVIIMTFLILTSTYAQGEAKEAGSLRTRMELEIAKDLKGQESCFKGAVLQKFKEMEASYGGRFNEGYTFEVPTVNSSEYRAPAKYCDIVDKNGRTVDYHRGVARHCVSTDSYQNVLALAFLASTTGTIENEGVIFKVEYERTLDMLVELEASYYPGPDEIISSKETESLVCTPLIF